MSPLKQNYQLDTSKAITDEQVRRVLWADKGSEARLSSWTTKDFTTKGDNYATLVTSVSVDYVLQGKEGSASYVVKINPKSGLLNMKPEFIRTLFLKENEFYCDIRSRLDAELRNLGLRALNVPRYYHSDVESYHEVIFLENLMLKGFQMYDRRKGMDVPHATLLLQELARLHAASLLLKARTPDTDLEDQFSFLKKDWNNISEKDILGDMCKHSFDTAETLLQRYEGYGKAVAWVAKVKVSANEIFCRQIKKEAPFEVICHGDCWNNNVLFRYNEKGQPVEVMLVDLQLVRVSSPATDLAYFLFTSLDGAVRKEHRDAFLSTYYEALSSVLRAAERHTPFTLQQLHQEYERKEEYGRLFSCMAVQVIMTSSEEIPDFGELKEEDLPKFMEEMKQKNLDRMEGDPIFRSRYLALFESLKDD